MKQLTRKSKLQALRDLEETLDVLYKVKKKKPSGGGCGAGAPGHEGFLPGNSCAGGGSGGSSGGGSSKPSGGKPSSGKPSSGGGGGAAHHEQLMKNDAGYASSYKDVKPGFFSKKPWQKAGLKREEAAAVHNYTDLGYQHLNKQLRNPPPDANTKAKQALLDQGLSKLPDHKGTVYRGVNKKLDFEVGAVVKDGGFSSSSPNKDIATINFSGGTLFKIKSKTGKDITSMSRFKSESEVLFKSGTGFKVTGKSTDSAGRVVYEMEEV